MCFMRADVFGIRAFLFWSDRSRCNQWRCVRIATANYQINEEIRDKEVRVIGADGGIGGTYAVMPELYLAMNEHINKGEIQEAQALQYEADRIIYKMCEAHGNLYAVQKEILRRMYGLELGGVREPMPSLIPEDEPIVAEAQAMIEAAIAKL